MHWDLFKSLQMENSTLIVKKRKINIQMRGTFPKLGFMYYSIRSGNSSAYLKPFASAVKFSWMLVEGEREREGGAGGGGGGGEEGDEKHTHMRARARARTHTRASSQTNKNLKLTMQFTVENKPNRHWEGRQVITLLVTEGVEQEFCERCSDTQPSWAVSSCQARFVFSHSTDILKYKLVKA